MNAPEFWQTGRGPWPWLLSPFACLYALGGRLRQALGKPTTVGVPVICVGNLSAGGTGKTPVAAAIAQMLTARGARPHFLSHGYGGALAGPLRVDPAIHSAADVGDEALLLAHTAPTWIARDRVTAAHAAIAAGATMLIMDDGFQDPSLKKDVALIVIDGGVGFGNGRVMPAGPLREEIHKGLERAHGAIIVGCDAAGVEKLLNARAANLPVLHAHLQPATDAQRLKGTRVFGFAGIGRPEKFRATLAEIGADIAGFRAFADHYVYTGADIDALRHDAVGLNAQLVTTAKDAARLGAAAKDIDVVEVTAVFDDEAALARLVTAA